jgi:hypothetical protein
MRHSSRLGLLTRCFSKGSLYKSALSEIESSRLILWQGQWQRVDGVAQALRQAHPESFRAKIVTCRNGQKRAIWAFTKTVRL